ncbi:MarR family transcriptional regulator [Mesorhizobium sp. VK23B]|uniref:MarR family transcriptional regulator n=1 Tax=Mesorhizobium dulcispinae TaxID=3072316 RepID=A0ABU4XSX3_9HYPH|nr:MULTISPECIES: MarR family transcriptional regulator [unclassified Mesorhizobium]MDX8470266.1 MarR family transcriptional regulator [Mesorhizobium sp. VK23B]MDX8476679.1 MarR family transcriptional regulator [Mesorhizobium sp. VK23A]
MADIEALHRELIAELIRADRRWRSIAEHAFLPLDISEPRAAPLLWIGRLGGGVWQSTVANKIGIRAPTLAQLISQLEAQGLVERRSDASDGRAKTLWLTEQGAELVAKLEERLNGLRAEILAKFDPAEIATTLQVLKALGTKPSKKARRFQARR